MINYIHTLVILPIIKYMIILKLIILFLLLVSLNFKLILINF